MSRKKILLHIPFYVGGISAFVAVVLLSLLLPPSTNGAAGPAFRAPLAPAPDNETVNNVDEITGFLKSDVAGEVQTVVSPLTVGTSTAAVTWLGAADASLASVVGAAGDATPISAPTLASLGVTNAVAYGYADGAASGAGVEGMAVASLASSGAGVQAVVVDAQGTAAAFDGRVAIQGDLYVEDSIAPPHVSITSSDDMAPSITASGGVNATAPLRNGLYGEAYGGDSTVYGLYGQTISPNTDTTYSSGIYAVNSVGAGLSPGPSFYGILAQSAATATGVGAYGLSASGNGISGIVDSSSSSFCGEAQATGSTGHALHASGSAFAAYFEGDVELASGAVLYIGATGIGENNLRQLLQWCNSGVRRFCPDAYE